MRRAGRTISTMIALLIALAVLAPSRALAADANPMYRLYNHWTGEHFYTASIQERDDLVNLGWVYESVGWFAPETSNTPVYRLYNKWVPGGDHHYTTSAKERDDLVGVGWTYEGVGWYSDDAKTVPLYRQYNPYAATGTHNYTADKAENDSLVKVGWKAEGIGWYGVEKPSGFSDTPVLLTSIRIDNVPTTITAGGTCKKAATVSGCSMATGVITEGWYFAGDLTSIITEDTYEDEPYPHTFPEAGTELGYLVVVELTGECMANSDTAVYINGVRYSVVQTHYGYYGGSNYVTIFTDYPVTVS